MENTLLTAAVIALAFGIKNNQAIQPNNQASINYSDIREAIVKARKALEQPGK